METIELKAQPPALDADVVRLLEKFERVVLAGGAARRLFFGESVPNNADWDIFLLEGCADDSVIVDWLVEQGYEHTFGSDWAETFRNEAGVTIQLIVRHIYSSIEKIFMDFDLRFCAFAYTSEGTFVVAKEAVADVIAKQLVVNNVLDPISTARRITKFVRQGYGMSIVEYAMFLKDVAANPEAIDNDFLLRCGSDSQVTI